MQVVCIASSKGGASKTTLAAHLGVEAERVGAGPVVLIDTDPQVSLADWWSARQAETPALGRISLNDLGAGLRILQVEGYRLCIIDTPPYALDSIRDVMAVADLVVIPTRPSPIDVRAIGTTVRMVEEVGKPLIFVICGAANRARITVEVMGELAQHGPVSPAVIYQRTDFASSMTDGRTAGELDPSGRSAAEITALWKFIAKRLEKRNIAPSHHSAHPRTKVQEKLGGMA